MIDEFLKLCHSVRGKTTKQSDLANVSLEDVYKMTTYISGKNDTVYRRKWKKGQPHESYFEDYYHPIGNNFHSREKETLYAICMGSICPDCLTFIPDAVKYGRYQKTDFDTINTEETEVIRVMEYDIRQHLCLSGVSPAITDYYSIRVICPTCKLRYEIAFRLHEVNRGNKNMRFKVDS